MQFLKRLPKIPFHLKEKISLTNNCYGKFPSRFFSSSQEATETPTTSSDVLNVLNSESVNYFRNIAIIAHVDHGKTTLVDALIRHSGAGNTGQTMDSNQLEQEKGITILSKCTGVTFKGHKINIVDTPGHHDFGGEVERIMSMVDGVALVVCAVEGPMTQTKFVLGKALKQNLKPIVVINKVDRPGSRVKEVENEIFDLFCSMDCSDEILDYPLFHASAKGGWAAKSGEDRKDITSILDAVIDYIPPPKVNTSSDFTMLVSQTESNPYFGKMLIGRINSGTVKVGDKLSAVDPKGDIVEVNKVFKIIRRYGMSHVEMPKAVAGDIVSIAGLGNGTVTHTLNNFGKNVVIPSIPIDPPMLSIEVSVNTSPLAGKEGSKLTASALKERLGKESENDVALRVNAGDEKGGARKDTNIEVQGRGDLHLGVLMEKLRREGYEMSITPPKVVLKTEGKKILEPIEKLIIEVGHEYSAAIIENVISRKGTLENCEEINTEKQKITFHIPTRGLLGLRSELLNDTKGTAVVITEFLEYQEHKGALKKTRKGAIISPTDGVCTAYGIKELEVHGSMFVKPGTKVYNGMVIGEHLKEDDIDLNPTKEKKLTNIRSVNAEEKVILHAPRVFTLEEAIPYVRDDELIEVTPENIRIRKKELDPSQRKKLRRDAKNDKSKHTK